MQRSVVLKSRVMEKNQEKKVDSKMAQNRAFPYQSGEIDTGS